MTTKRRPAKRTKKFDIQIYGPTPRTLGISSFVLLCGIFGYIGVRKLQLSNAAAKDASTYATGEVVSTSLEILVPFIITGCIIIFFSICYLMLKKR